jgi:hypothetical protein
VSVRRIAALVLVMVLSGSWTIAAAPKQPPVDSQEALIRQVLTATADDLGWPSGPVAEGTIASGISSGMTNFGVPYWDLYNWFGNPPQSVFVRILAHDSPEAARSHFEEYSSSTFAFHGYSAKRVELPGEIDLTVVDFLADRFLVESVSQSNFPTTAMEMSEAFYENAVALGLFAGDGATAGTVAPATTVVETVVTQPGAAIVLSASKDGYGAASQTISNVDNIQLMILEGRVLDQFGAFVEGATVEVVSGADPASATTGADGRYSLAVDVSGGEGTASASGIDLTVQLGGDLTIARIELVQAVSGAELADGKATAALVFPGFVNPAEATVDTTVALYVNGNLLQTLPFHAKGVYDADDHRRIADAAQFFIPASAVRTGTLDVRAVVDPDGAFEEIDEANNELTQSRIVAPSRGLSMVMVALSPSISATAARDWATTARRFLANTYPVSSVRIEPHPVASNGWLTTLLALRDAAIVDAARVAYNAANPAWGVEFGVGLVPYHSYGEARGLVYRVLYPSAPLVDITFPITTAHEIGHVYLGATEEADIMSGIALPEGYTYDAIGGTVTYIPPGSDWINFMGDPYAGYTDTSPTAKVNAWISPTASNTILTARQTTRSAGLYGGDRTSLNWSANMQFDRVMYLSGYFEEGELRLLPPQMLPTGEVGEYPTGEYVATMEAADGTALASATFAVDDQPGEYDAPNPGSFHVEVPFPADTARLVISNDNQELYRLERSSVDPTVAVDQPGGGAPVDGQTTVNWSANDADGDALTYNVYYSPDDGDTWQLLGLNWTDASLPIDTSLLPGSNTALIRVVASDGLNTGQAESLPFVVPLHAPVATITRPDAAADPWIVGTPNILVGTAEDIEDGPLPPESLEWISNLDGPLGNGSTLTAQLSEGQHTVTLTATDLDGQQASATVTVIATTSEVGGLDNTITPPVASRTRTSDLIIAFAAALVIGVTWLVSRRRNALQTAGRTTAAGQRIQRPGGSR